MIEVLISDADYRLAQTAAMIRHNQDKEYKTSKPLSDDYQLVGCLGEIAFACAFGFAWDSSNKPMGDGGVDFSEHTMTVDVKSARIPKWLFYGLNKKPPTVIVLAKVHTGNRRVQFVGWEYGDQVMEAPVGDMTGQGIQHHYILSSELRDMDQFRGKLRTYRDRVGAL